jgi:hypothetical protein
LKSPETLDLQRDSDGHAEIRLARS